MRRQISTAVGSALLAVVAACSGDAPTAAAPGGGRNANVAVDNGDAAIIGNGTLKLGIDRAGYIGVEGYYGPAYGNRDSIGLVYLPSGQDGMLDGNGTSYAVEGWGIAAFYEPTRFVSAVAHSSGFDGQRSGINQVSFTSTENSAVSVTTIRQPGGAEGPFVRITHDFHPVAATDNLYEVAVTFENVSSTPVSDLRYTRQVYWVIDGPYGTFSTLQGTSSDPIVIRATDGGADFSPVGSGRGPTLGGAVGDMVDNGPRQHGAHLDLDLAELPPGEKKTVYFYYGAAQSEAAAIEAAGKVGATMYALGQSDPSGEPETFIFAFKREASNAAPIAEASGPSVVTKGQTVHFSAAGSSDPDGDDYTCSWDFGDGETATGCEVDHTFNLQRTGFTVVLTVTDSEGATGTATLAVEMTAANQPPVADPNGPYTGDIGAEIAFSSEGSRDPEGGDITYLWEFPDGTTSTSPSPTHTFTAAGDYTVKLTVTDPEGLTGSAMTTVTIAPDQPPPACSEGTGAAPTLKLFRAYSRTEVGPFDDRIPNVEMIHFGFADPDCGGWTAHIEWGDGATDEFEIGTELGPADNYVAYHDYAAAGSYEITMTITDAAGRASAEQRITVVAAPAAASK